MGEQAELQVVADFADQKDVLLPGDYLNWSSESEGVASVSDRGVITGVANDTTIFSVERNDLTAVTASRVGQAGFPNTEAELNTAIAEYYGLDVYPDASTLTIGTERQILVGIEGQADSADLSDDETGTRYFVNNPDVISVDEDGLITTLSEGEAEVTVIHGGAESIIPVNVETPNIGATTLDVDGGIVENAEGYQVMIPEGALTEDAEINITSVEQSELNAPLPEKFEVIDAFNLSLGDEDLTIPSQLAIPAPEGLTPGTEVFFMRDGELPDETGTWNPLWLVEESGIVGSDGMIRTSSPPWPGIKKGDDYIITVPKFEYKVGKAYGFVNTLSGTNSIAGVAAQSAGVGIFGFNFGAIFGIPIFYEATLNTVEVITIPKIGALPTTTTAGVTINPKGVPTANVELDVPSLGENDPFAPPVIEQGELNFEEKEKPIVYLTGSNFLVDSNEPNAVGSSFDDLSPFFEYGGESYPGTVIPELSEKLGNNRYQLAIEVPQTVVLGQSSIKLERVQEELNGVEPTDIELTTYLSETGITIKPNDTELTLAAQAFNDQVSVFNALNPEEILETNGLTSRDLLLAQIPVGTGGNFDDEPRDLVATKDATRAYVSLRSSGKLAVIDLLSLQQVDTNPETKDIIDPIQLPANAAPHAIATSFDDRYAYVGDYRSGSIYIVDIDSTSDTYHQVVEIINIADAANGFHSLAVSSDGKKLFASVPSGNSKADKGKVYVFNINSEDKPKELENEPGQFEPNTKKWHDVIGVLEVEKGVEGISATPDPNVMVFTNRFEDFKGFGRIKITSEDPTQFAASVSYTALGLGSTGDYFDVNDARDVVITSDGKYGFVAGANARNFGSGAPSIDGPKAGSNVGIIVDPLTENAKLVAATRPIPNGLTSSITISSDDKYLFASYPGVGGVYAWDVEEMVSTIDDPSSYQIDHRGRGVASPVFLPSTQKSATKADLSSVPIDNINPDITIASDLQLTKDTYRFDGFEYVNDVEFGVPEDSKRAPLTIGANPWSVTNVNHRDWLELENEQWREIEYSATSDDDGNVTIKPTWVDSSSVDVPIPPTTLDETVSTSKSQTLPELEPIIVPAGEPAPIPVPKLPAPGTGLVIGVGLAVLTWLITTSDVVEVELNISTSPSGEGLFSEEDGFVQRPPAAGIKEDDLKTTKNGIDDYNPNRVRSVKWKQFTVGLGKWEIDGELIDVLLPPTVFPFAHLLNLTAGQKYFYGVRAKSQTKGWETENGGEFTLPLADVKGRNDIGGIPLPGGATAYSSVTFITPEASALDPQGLVKANAIAQKIAKNIEGDVDGEDTVDGTVLKYNPSTGKWDTVSGDRELGKPLVLIADWSQDSVAENYNSGFAEGAADSLFASLVEENSIFEGVNKDALFDSPFHFIGMGRGTVVNSEIIQRLGTFYPKPVEPDNFEDPNYQNRNLFPDLQMTTIDPNDFSQLNIAGLSLNNFYDPAVQVWDNVTFADNYYQTASSSNPRGRHISNTIPEYFLPPNSPTYINESDLSVHLGGYEENSNQLLERSRVGFTPDTAEQPADGKNPHNRTDTWYGGTVNVSWDRDNNPFNAAIHRRKGDFSYSELNPDPDYLYPWYTPTHIPNLEVGDEDAQWEGIGTGWYYSPQGGGYNRRALTLDSPQSVTASDNSPRTPVEFDNTLEARQRGDFAVPTLFDGNFDAIYAKNPAQPIPGWTNDGSEKNLQKYLKSGVADNQSYALELGNGLDEITHNPFVVPDWGTLRFDIHTGDVPATSTDRLQVTIQATDGSEVSTQIELQEAGGTAGQYLNDTRRISYGETGFETFTLDVPDELRGKVATLKFELTGGQEVYLDNVFFKSQHLLFGNPSEARKPDNPELNKNNYLLEKPQYAVSYNDSTKQPNLVSWQVNQDWVGTGRDADWGQDETLPDDWYKVTDSDYKATNLNNLFDDFDLFGNPLFEAPGTPQLVSYNRGHLTPNRARNRNRKDSQSTFLFSNALPQHPNANQGGSPWFNLEEDLRDIYVDRNNDELYITAGSLGTKTQPVEGGIPGETEPVQIPLPNDNISTPNEKFINVPQYIWQFVLVLDQPGYGLEDVIDGTTTAEAIAVMMPNYKYSDAMTTQPITLPTGKVVNINSFDDWKNWETWRVNGNDLESVTGYNFLSNLPELLQDNIEEAGVSPSLTAPLLAESAELSTIEIPNTTVGHNSIAKNSTISVNIPFNTSQISLDENSVGQGNVFYSGSTQSSLGEINSVESTLHDDSIVHIGSVKDSSTDKRLREMSFTQVGIDENSFINLSPAQVSPTQISSSEVDFFEFSPTEVGVGEIAPTQISVPKISPTEVGVGEIAPTQISVPKISPNNSNLTKISFASSISPEQFFSVHNSTPKITNVLNNSATNIWSDLLQSETQLDIDFQITDLPKGQLASATITGFDDAGKPNAGTILIDHDANGIGWFIDETPLDNSEFTAQNTDSYLLAATESEADGKYDLLTTVLHELSHLYGFIDGYEGFDDRIETKGDTSKFIGDDFTATLDGEHLDKSAYPYDLLNTHLAPGMRKLPSELDVQILQALIATELEKNGNKPAGDELLASLTSDPLLAIANGDFEIDDTTTDSFAWDTRGASGIEAGQAVLTEDSPFLSNFTQTFTVPEEAKTIQFKLIETELGASELAPPDAFEVALLDANTNESLVTDNDLSETDSLLNIQNDGTAYFSDKVRIGGAASADIIGLDKSRTVTVDISDLTPGTEATLYFDLLGFGDVDSRVAIDDVRLWDQNLLPPTAVDDNATTTQGQSTIIDILANDTDDDGAIATDSIQIATEPTKGAVTVNDDGTVTYTPSDRAIGTDSFTYVVQDNDGQLSEPASVSVQVENVAPEITEIQIPDDITEGDEITLNAIATDAGNDELTYAWEFDDNTTSEGQSVVRTYVNNGTYTGTVTVTDTNGGSDTQDFEVVVANAAPVVDAGEDRTVDEGSSVAFTGSFTDAGINDTHTVTWDFGDGSDRLSINNEQLSIEHIYTDDGEYIATYTVTDNDGAVSSDELTVTVNNVAPTITNLTGDSTVNEGDTVNFTASATDPGNDTITYTWDFGDGSETAEGAEASHIFSDNGIYSVTLTAQDEDGGETAQTLEVTVENIAPTFTEINGKTTVNEGEAVDYSAAATDPGDDELTYTWNFGDGTPEVTGADATHTFADNGIYDATVTATDDDGAATTSNLSITVNNVAPTLNTDKSKTGEEGQAVSFEATFDDAGNDDLTVTWDFGDGSDAITTEYPAESTPNSETQSHVYAADGTYTATVTVTDSDGAVTKSTIDVTISNTPPVIESLTGNTEINEGDTASFKAIATDAGDDTLTYTWDFGDGVTGTGVDISHIFTDNGDYTVTLTVADEDGGETSQTLDVTVNNVAPTFTEVNGETTIDEGEAVDYSAVATDPGDDELTYTWNFGDGTPEVTGADATHTFTNNGAYNATVTVNDDDGAATTSNFSITVNNVAPTLDTAESKTGQEGQAVSFEAIFNDPGNDDLTVTWNFGDGGEAITTEYPAESDVSSETQNHIYVSDGIYTATVTVTDSDGAITESTIDVTIDNAAPVIESLTGDTEINEGDTASFNAIATDPGNDELTYTWNFGDGSEAITTPDTLTPITHTYTDNGDYTVSLTVTDTSGATDSSTLDVTVNNTAPVITDITDDLIINEGDTASLNVSATDAGNDVLTYAWDFGDGSQTLMGENVEHIFVDNGLYEASVTVTDDDGASVTQSLTITVNNLAPIIDPWDDETATEGDTVELAASFSDRGILDTHTIAWDFGDGNTTSDTLTPSHVYTDDGVYEVTLTVTDNDGASTSSSINVTVNNAAPAITSLTGDTQINEGDRANFSASATDPGSDELSYTWDFGDGETATGTDVTHAFAQNGNYTVIATVTDDDGAFTNSTLEVVVNNVAPVIESLTGDTEVNEGDVANFSAAATDAGNDELTYTWDFGDGSETVTGRDVAHTFADNGDYTVTLTVTDSDGASTSQALDVAVSNIAPTITNADGDRIINEGDTASFTASATDPSNDTLTYTWNLADGTELTGANVTQTFTEDGEYDLNLIVTDDDGATATQTLTITVNNLAPIIEVGEDKTSDEGSPVQFNASFSDPGIEDTHTIAWDFGDGNIVTDTLDPTHVYINNGEYDVSLTVTDDEGASTTSTLKVTVNNVTPTITSITGDTEINEGDVANFSAVATDPGADELTYTWNFGDGTTPINGQNATYQYLQDGIYNTTLTVSDSDGASTSQTTQITVNNLPPTVSAGNNQTVYIGETVNFNGTFSDRGSLDTHTITWNFGDNTSTSATNNPTHTYTAEGIYTVNYSVRDDRNASSSDTLQLTVLKLPTLAVNDISIVEGDSGTANALFTVSLNEASTRAVKVNYRTANGTATAGSDYTATSGTLTFAPGQTSQTVAVSVTGDRLDEIDENFRLNLTSPVNATIADNRGIATIIDNDPAPSLTINDSTITEGDNGTSNLTLTVNLSGASGKTVTANYTTADGTATAGVDYTATTGTLTFNPGQTSQTIVIPITGDRLDEIDETLTVTLNNPTNATIADGTGVGTILDNNPAPSLSLNDPSITEGDSGNQTFVFNVNLSAVSSKTVTVNYRTADGTATAGADYTATSGTLTFAPGQTSQTVAVSVTGDRITENNETILLNLTNPVNATIADTQGLGTIIDNDLNSYGIKAEGQVFINSSSDFDGVANNPNDDVKIYAGKGFTFNGNIALSVKLDEAGNPIRSNGKLVLVERAVAVAPGYLTSNASSAKNQYANLLPPQVIEAQTVNVPVYGDLSAQELTRRIPTGTPTVTFNAAQNPLNNTADWTNRFPAPGTPTRPTVVKVTGGGLNIPSNVNLNNYVITVESGDINFNGSGHNLNNVMLKTNNGNVNLANVSAQDLSLFASGSINTNSGARFAGDSLLTTGTSNGNITFNGATNTIDESSRLRVISAGDLNYNGATNTRGELIAAKNFFFNGSSSLYGSIAAKGNITFNGSATVIGVANSSPN